MGLGQAFEGFFQLEPTVTGTSPGEIESPIYAGSCVHEDQIFDCIAINLIKQRL